MTKKEAVVIEAYTGVGMLTGEDRNLFYKYINQNACINGIIDWLQSEVEE